MNYICIVAHGEAKGLARCIESVRDTVSQPYEINVLTQCATPALRRRLETLYRSPRDMSIYHSFQNLGAIGGRLRLADVVRNRINIDIENEFVTWLDDDVVARDDLWDSQLMGMARQYGIATQVAVDIRPDWTDFHEPPDLKADPGPYDVCGGGMTMMQAVYIVAGAEYDQSFRPFWHADSDYALQCKALGAQVWGCYVGLQHEFNHKRHDFYWQRNWLKLRAKWQGQGLTKAEQ